MKTIGNYIIALIMMTSCSNYHVISINSNDTQPNNFNEWVNVSTNFEVAHSFKGQNIPIHFRVYNDDQRSYLNVDWENSFIIADKDTLRLTVPRGQQAKAAIKPGEFIDFSSRAIASRRFVERYKNASTYSSSLSLTDGRVSSDRSTFNSNSTPLAFSTHLKLSFFEDFTDSFYAVSNFWVDNVYRVRVGENRLANGLASNQTFIESGNSEDFGAFVGAAVVASIPALMAIGFMGY